MPTRAGSATTPPPPWPPAWMRAKVTPPRPRVSVAAPTRSTGPVAVASHVLGDRTGDRHHRDAERHVQEEHQAPRHGLDQPPTQERAEGVRHATERRPRADRPAPLPRGEAGLEDRQAAGEEEGARRALEHPRGHQHGEVGRCRAGRRRGHEQHHPDAEHPAPPVAVAERAAHQDQRGQGQQVAGEDPLEARQLGVEVRTDGGQRHVHHGGIEGHQRRPEHRRDQNRAPGTGVEAEALLRVGDGASPAPIAAPRRAVTPPAYVRPMSLSAQFVPYGRPGAVRLQALLVELRGADPLAPATVVVPRSWVGLSLRRQLVSGTVSATPGAAGLANVRFPTLDHLAEELGGPVLQTRGRTPLTSTAVSAAARAALRAQPGVLAPVAEHAATEAAVADSWRALRDATPADLHALGGRGRRQADVVRLTADVGCRLAGSYDARDAATAAVEALGRDASLVAGTGPIVVHLPAGLPPHHLALLRALGDGHHGGGPGGRHRRPVGRRRGPRPRRATSGPPAPASSCSPRPAPPPPSPLPMPTPRSSRPCATSRRRVAAGTPLDRIAIAYGPASPYAALLHERCAAAGLPVVGPATRTLAQTLAGRALLGALDLHASAWRRDDVVAWLATAPLQHRGRVVDAVEADRLSRRAGVTRGPRALAERPRHVVRRARPPPRGAAVRRGPGRRGPRPTGGPRP